MKRKRRKENGGGRGGGGSGRKEKKKQEKQEDLRDESSLKREKSESEIKMGVRVEWRWSGGRMCCMRDGVE